MLFNISLVVVLLICSAYFSACETAITACSKHKIFSLSNEGNKKAIIITKLREEISLVISSILVCATILNALTVAVTTNMFVEVLGDCAIFFAPIITSIFIVLFAEVLPKMLTIASPEDILLPSAVFIKYTHVVLKPLNRIIGFVASRIISIIRRSSKHNEFESSLNELRGAIALHKGIDIEDTEKEKEMLQSVLDLGTVQVSNIIVHRKNVTMFCADESIDTLVDRVMDCPFTRVPLWSGEQDNIVGVLHANDFLKAIKRCSSIEDLNVLEIARKPWFIPENKDLLDQLQDFKQRHEHFAVVVDEYGSFMGIITLEDILEEIVGNIEDEHDVAAVAGIRQQLDGSYVVDGSVNIRDLNREIDSKFKSDMAATVAGLVINSVGIIPEIGQTFVLHGYKFDILKRQRNQVTLLKVSTLSENENAEK
ncbi:MAG: CNNM domain-containing protein [Holosporales bacterium]|jgi:Mg2+/Co2+ transporter CorB|nr:CNNM domain-containing protein [Holosporales bacterium]